VSQLFATPDNTGSGLTPNKLGNKPPTVYFNGWYLFDRSVNSVPKNSTLLARITLSGGDPGQYKTQVIRDVNLASDETTKELPFTYDGISATKEISFSPTYSTKEANTNGYQVNLEKNGDTIWTLTNAYPPRLRVTSP
jgi:hypothetical protein